MTPDVKFVMLDILVIKDTICYVIKMWRMALFICDNCGEHKNTVGHYCYIPSDLLVVDD